MQTGKLFSFFKANNSNTYSINAYSNPAPGTVNIADVTVHSGNVMLAYDNTNSKPDKIVINAGIATTTASSVNGTNTTGTVSSIASVNNTLLATGSISPSRISYRGEPKACSRVRKCKIKK